MVLLFGKIPDVDVEQVTGTGTGPKLRVEVDPSLNRMNVVSDSEKCRRSLENWYKRELNSDWW